MTDRARELTNIVMPIVANYIEEMMWKLVKTIEESSVDTFSKQEVVAMLKVHTIESHNRLLSSRELTK